MPRRRLGSAEGRAALVHAIAHIEFNAINLGLDATYRFRDMPESFYTDWLSVADDEARHFEMLAGRLTELGHDYGETLPKGAGIPVERAARAIFEAGGIEALEAIAKIHFRTTDKVTGLF